MADYKFKERCPCGDEVEFISYSSREMDSHVDRWRKIHRPHMTAIAKAIAENVKWPMYYVAPPSSPIQPLWPQNPVTFKTEIPGAGPKAES